LFCKMLAQSIRRFNRIYVRFLQQFH
jgi:hypothetical protein